MVFEITTHRPPVVLSESPPQDTSVLYRWTLRTKDAELARSPIVFDSEASCRAHIASVRTPLKGARFAKVKVIG